MVRVQKRRERKRRLSSQLLEESMEFIVQISAAGEFSIPARRQNRDSLVADDEANGWKWSSTFDTKRQDRFWTVIWLEEVIWDV